jgi:bla regulator protein blaR1
MMLWCLYAMCVALLLGVAAWLGEQSARRRARPSRWMWLASLVFSGVLAILGLWSQPPTSSMLVDGATPSTDSWRQVAKSHVPLPVLRVQERMELQLQRGTDLVDAETRPRLRTEALHLSLSACVLAGLVLNGWTLHRRARQWRRTVLLGTTVHVASDAGPAVVGLFRPRIVVPEWLLDSPVTQQELVLAHEQSHLDARDPQCLAVALILLVAMPWNLPLWWQIKRLRRAMEVDCDARVLSCGHAPSAYGKVLLAVVQRRSVRLNFASAMSESTSFLEQRLNIMLRVRRATGPGRMAAVLLSGLALAMAAAATQLSPPSSVLVLSPSALDALDGDYQTAEQEILRVSHEGARLFMQSTGRPRVEWQARSNGELVALNGRQRATLQRDAEGHVRALTLYLHGVELTAQRVSKAQAQRIADGVASRIREQVASSGTEAAIRRFYSQIQMTPAKLDGLGPLMAAGVREQSEQMRPVFSKLGAVRSVEFAGVSETGYDKYLMRCEGGSVLWQILLDADGTISRVNFTFPTL